MSYIDWGKKAVQSARWNGEVVTRKTHTGSGRRAELRRYVPDAHILVAVFMTEQHKRYYGQADIPYRAKLTINGPLYVQPAFFQELQLVIEEAVAHLEGRATSTLSPTAIEFVTDENDE